MTTGSVRSASTRVPTLMITEAGLLGGDGDGEGRGEAGRAGSSSARAARRLSHSGQAEPALSGSRGGRRGARGRAGAGVADTRRRSAQRAGDRGARSSAFAPRPAVRVEMTVERSNGTLPFSVDAVPPITLRSETEAAANDEGRHGPPGHAPGLGLLPGLGQDRPDVRPRLRGGGSPASGTAVSISWEPPSCRRRPRPAPCRSGRPWPGCPRRGGPRAARRARRARGRVRARSSPLGRSRRRPGGRP